MALKSISEFRPPPCFYVTTINSNILIFFRSLKSEFPFQKQIKEINTKSNKI